MDFLGESPSFSALTSGVRSGVRSGVCSGVPAWLRSLSAGLSCFSSPEKLRNRREAARSLRLQEPAASLSHSDREKFSSPLGSLLFASRFRLSSQRVCGRAGVTSGGVKAITNPSVIDGCREAAAVTLMVSSGSVGQLRTKVQMIYRWLLVMFYYIPVNIFSFNSSVK